VINGDARADASPSLALSYASGGGNSAFGAGWNLGLDTRYRIEKWVDMRTGRVHFRTRDAYNYITVRPRSRSKSLSSRLTSR
jgi:hypothetical protein